VGQAAGQVGSAIGQGAQAVGKGVGQAGQAIGSAFGGGGGAAATPVNVGGAYLGGGAAQGPLGLGAQGAAGVNMGGPVLQGAGSAVNAGPMASWGGMNAGGSPSGFSQIQQLYGKYGKYARMLSAGQGGGQKQGLAQPEPAPAGGLMRGAPAGYQPFQWVGNQPPRMLYGGQYDWRRY
jgi:hypothetical protein